MVFDYDERLCVSQGLNWKNCSLLSEDPVDAYMYKVYFTTFFVRMYMHHANLTYLMKKSICIHIIFKKKKKIDKKKQNISRTKGDYYVSDKFKYYILKQE